MVLRIALILCFSWPVFASGQTVVIDIEYQPNTTYQWSRSYINDRTIEYLGAEDLGDYFQQLGLDPYSERHDDDYLEVSMRTMEEDGQKLPYVASVEGFRDDYKSSNPRASGITREPLEIHDLVIHGVINHFQKIEIDSIHGVDSLSEKNKVFKLLDDTHRSWKFPNDSLTVGQKVETEVNFTGFQFQPAKLITEYHLEKIEGDVAHIRLEMRITTEKQENEGGLLDKRNVQGTGAGLLLYNRKLKQVTLLERKMSVKSFSETMNLSMESAATSTYRWTMNVIN